MSEGGSKTTIQADHINCFWMLFGALISFIWPVKIVKGGFTYLTLAEASKQLATSFMAPFARKRRRGQRAVCHCSSSVEAWDRTAQVVRRRPSLCHQPQGRTAVSPVNEEHRQGTSQKLNLFSILRKSCRDIESWRRSGRDVTQFYFRTSQNIQP